MGGLGEGRNMDTTMQTGGLLSRKLTDAGLTQFEVRPTYASPDQRDADGEVTVYGPGMVQLTSEVVQKGDDPEAVAGTILARVRDLQSGS